KKKEETQNRFQISFSGADEFSCLHFVSKILKCSFQCIEIDQVMLCVRSTSNGQEFYNGSCIFFFNPKNNVSAVSAKPIKE
ncbi:MAG: hypothetical protein EBS17_08220, partial [Flavobacteriia bacterium]|nr:hypothetical protein [Flavobacteriia bacterium]